jgi:hypothetical protein
MPSMGSPGEAVQSTVLASRGRCTQRVPLAVAPLGLATVYVDPLRVTVTSFAVP